MNNQSDLEKIRQCARKTSIGGQALMEGIMMRGPKKTAMAVRNPKGEIVTEEWETASPSKKKFNVMKIPVVRGVFAFASSMSLGYKCLMRSAEISALDEIQAEIDREKREKKAAKAAKNNNKHEAVVQEKEETVVAEASEINSQAEDCTAWAEDTQTQNESEEIKKEPEETKKEKESGAWYMVLITVISAILGVALAVGLFMWLPTQLFSWLAMIVPGLEADDRIIKTLFESCLRLAIMIGYMLIVSQLKDIKRTFMFHGAEHKTIFCYESGLELTVENVRMQRRFHPRCGTSFLVVMILVGMFISFFIPPEWNTGIRTLTKIALLPITMGIGYEFIKLAGKHDNVITRILSAPGLWFQRITVLEPDDGMIECAIVAMKRVIPDDGSDKI